MADLTKVRLYLIDPATGAEIEAVDVRSAASAISTTEGSTVQAELDTLKQSVGGTTGEGPTIVEQVTTNKQSIQQNTQNITQNASDIEALEGDVTALEGTVEGHTGNADVHVDKTKRDSTFIDCTLDNQGVLTYTKYDGTTKKIDTKLEKIAVNFALNETSDGLVITLDDGTKQEVSLSAFIDIYKGTSGKNIVISVDPSTKEISANIVAASITMDSLADDVKQAITAAATASFTEELKQKLMGIEAGANNYKLPAATKTTLGGMIVGNGLSVDATGKVNTTNVVYGTSYKTATPAILMMKTE